MYFLKIKTLYCVFTLFAFFFNLLMCQIILADPVEQFGRRACWLRWNAPFRGAGFLFSFLFPLIYNCQILGSQSKGIIRNLFSKNVIMQTKGRGSKHERSLSGFLDSFFKDAPKFLFDRIPLDTIWCHKSLNSKHQCRILSATVSSFSQVAACFKNIALSCSDQ